MKYYKSLFWIYKTDGKNWWCYNPKVNSPKWNPYDMETDEHNKPWGVVFTEITEKEAFLAIL